MPGEPELETPSELIDAQIKELDDWRGEMLSRIRGLTKHMPGFSNMELAGLEPATSWVRSRRSPN